MEDFQKTLLTVPQVAEAVALHPQTVYALINGGQFPHLRVGRSLRVPADELEFWISTNVKGSSTSRSSVS